VTDRETSVLLDEAAGRVPVGPPPTAQLVRAGRRARRRRAAGATLAVAAGVAVVVGGVVTVVDLDRDGGAAMVAAESAEDRSEPESAPDQDSPAAASALGAAVPEDPTAGRSGALAEGAGVARSCVQEYSAAAVAERDFAFDGVVVAIGPSVSTRADLPGPPEELVGVTFAVQEWFAGGSAPTVTVDLPAPDIIESGTTAPGPAYGVGSRLLVSGADRWDGPPPELIAWMCGFTRYYDEDTAASWR
jgi:hypothetical protein